MILSDKDIEKYIKEGKIKVKPLPNLKTQIGPASLDLRLGQDIRIFNHTQKPFIDPKNKETFSNLTKIVRVSKNNPFVIQPGQFILGSTLEEIEINDSLCGRIEGRSSWGRLGLIIHSTAGYIDPGFKGKLTLEITNIGMLPILLYPGIKICQISFGILSSPCRVPYGKRKSSKYFNSQKPLESRIYKEF